MEITIANEGIMPLFNCLKEVDPEQAAKIHPNNHLPVIRALENYETTGKTMTASQQEQSHQSPYNIVSIGLAMDRTLLYNQINHRIDLMMKDGLLNEVKNLYEQGYEDCQSMRAIGYKEFLLSSKEDQMLERSIRSEEHTSELQSRGHL